MNSDYALGKLGIYYLFNTKTSKRIGKAELRSRDAAIKNNAFALNKVNKKYVLFTE